MSFLILLIWMAIIIYGLVFGLTYARLTMRLFSNDTPDVNYGSGAGALLGGSCAFIAGLIFFFLDPIPASLFTNIEKVLSYTTTATVIIPACECTYRFVRLTVRLTMKVVDKIFKPKDR